MRFYGIDVASEKHFVAGVNEGGEVILKAQPFGENASGYAKLRQLVGEPVDAFVVMEATGHYWLNLFVMLHSEGFSVAVVNPLRTRRFAEEDLRHSSSDAIDALGIAKFGREKAPAPTRMPDEASRELRELVRLRTDLEQEFGDKTRKLHRLLDLTFPEYTTHMADISNERSTTILGAFPSGAKLAEARLEPLSNLRYGARHHRVGDELAKALISAAGVTVGRHQGEIYEHQVGYYAGELDRLRVAIKALDSRIGGAVERHAIAKLITTIDGIGPLTSARIIAAVGNPALLDSASSLGAYVGAIPTRAMSGKGPKRFPVFSNADLRKALWMPTIAAIKCNPWLKAFYNRLRAAGKPPKVAVLAAMRKLTTAIYSVAKSGKPFVPNLAPASRPT